MGRIFLPLKKSIGRQKLLNLNLMRSPDGCHFYHVLTLKKYSGWLLKNRCQCGMSHD